MLYLVVPGAIIIKVLFLGVRVKFTFSIKHIFPALRSIVCLSEPGPVKTNKFPYFTILQPGSH